MGNRITKTDRRVRINHKAGQRRRGPVQFGLGVLCLLLMSSSVRADEGTWTFTGYEDSYTTIASSGLLDGFAASARTPTGQRIAVGFTKNDPFFLGGFTANENFNFGVVRYDPDGSLDPSFTPSCAPLFINCTTSGSRMFGFQSSYDLNLTYTYSDDKAADVVVRASDGAIFVVGESIMPVGGSPYSKGAILKLNPDGTLDSSFDGDGKLLLTIAGGQTSISAAGLQSDGKLVVAGEAWTGMYRHMFVARILNDGTLDGSFGWGGWRTTDFNHDGETHVTQVNDLEVGSDTVAHDDSITVVGNSRANTEIRGHVAIARFEPDGGLDASFVGIASGRVLEEFGTIESSAYGVEVEPDGSVVIAGNMYPSTNSVGLIARWNASGVLQASLQKEAGVGYAGTVFQDLVRITPSGIFYVVGWAKGGTTGNDSIFFLGDAAISTALGPQVLFDGAGYASDVTLLGDSNYMAITGASSGEAAIYQATFAICGNGNVESGEDCDGGACCDECAFVPNGTVCNPEAGICDVAEVCSGADATCPADEVAAAGTVCNVAVGSCDVAETCDGVAVDCPADGFAGAGTVCQPSAGDCDVAEECTGLGPNCPVDDFAAAGTVCNAAAGICDVAEECTGAGPACPADTFVAAGTVCNPVNPNPLAVCDVAEECTGADADCPADGYLPAGSLCRPGVDLCDADETCTGTGIFCPADQTEPAGTLCRGAVDACDVAETCDGVAPSCPADLFAPAGTPALVLCDDGEACSADLCDGSGGCDNSSPATSAGIDFNEDGFIDAADDIDSDGDGILDACDNCTNDCNPDQLDTEGDCGGAVAPWNQSGAPECGDVCDVCPANDEVTLALDPACAVFDYNAPDECCEEVGTGVSVGPAGESCGGPAGNTEFTATGANSSMSMRIPPGAVDEDTSFSADSVTKGNDEFFVRGGGGRYVAGWDFGPEGVTFDAPLQICMTWNDADDNGFLDTYEGYAFRVTEANIKPYHVDAINGEFALADKCSLAPCGAFDGNGFVSDWGLHTNTGLPNRRYDEPDPPVEEPGNPIFDESTLGACCGATENKYCFEVNHFSTYAFGDPNCRAENLDRSKLKVVKLNKEVGEQKIVLKTEFTVPLNESTNLPDPAINPIAQGFLVSLLDTVSDQPTLWSALAEAGAFDKATKSGWKRNSKGTAFTYKAKNRADGLKTVVIQTAYNKTPGLVKVKVVANKAAVAIDSSVIQAEISLDPAGFLDQCARTDFELPSPTANGFCATNGSGTALLCR